MNNHLANYFKNTSPEQHEKYLAESKTIKGLSWDKNRSAWEVRIKGVRVGRFQDFNKAVKARVKYISDHGEFERLSPSDKVCSIGLIAEKINSLSDYEKATLQSMLKCDFEISFTN